ncbi:MAG: hypothetical protein GC181_08225 [Bacteroidetes bacterium]|nr:hypothetical protein [Bacteroidota bacterium]
MSKTEITRLTVRELLEVIDDHQRSEKQTGMIKPDVYSGMATESFLIRQDGTVVGAFQYIIEAEKHRLKLITFKTYTVDGTSNIFADVLDHLSSICIQSELDKIYFRLTNVVDMSDEDLKLMGFQITPNAEKTEDSDDDIFLEKLV